MGEIDLFKIDLRFSRVKPMYRVDRYDTAPRTVGVLHKNPASGNPGRSHDAALINGKEIHYGSNRI